MALPKYKTSRANTHSRRANWKASAVQTVTCPNCGSQAFPHMACPSCGTFRGRVYREAIRSEHTKQVLLIETLPSTGGRVFLFLAYCGCEGWGCLRDDLLSRSIVLAKATRSVSLLRWKVQWTFHASSAERQLAVRTALRSYTLFGLSGCIVKFSFLVTFFQKQLFIKKILLSLRFYIARPSNTHPSLLRKQLVFFVVRQLFLLQ